MGATGLVAPNKRSSKTAIAFARIVQGMIKEVLETPSDLRRRIFENRSVAVRLGNGISATFTECRRTMFRRLRKAADLTEESYLSSMCSQPFLGGKTEASGKSGSLFLGSHDNKFVLKTIERH